MPRRKYVVALLAALVLLLTFWGSDGFAGAAVTNAAPWPVSETPDKPATNDPNADYWGECNETLFSSGATGGLFTSGYALQLACQGEYQTGSTVWGMFPTMPTIEHSYYSGSGTTWTSNSYAAEWTVMGSGPTGRTAYTGSGTCTTPAGTVTPSAAIWSQVLTSSYYCAPTSAASLAPDYVPSGLDGSGSGAKPWTNVEQVQQLQVGSSITASDGVSFVPFQSVSDVWLNGTPTCATACSTGPEPSYEPDVPLLTYPGSDPESSTDCNAQPAETLITPGNDSTWGSGGGGYATPANEDGAGDSPVLSLASIGGSDSTGMGNSGSGGSSGVTNAGETAMALDSFHCLAGPLTPGEIDTALPTTYFTGGSATSLSPISCGLLSVTGYSPEDSSGDVSTLQSGKTYSVTFTYQGTVSQIAVDPEDGASDSLAFGSIDIGSDSTIVNATGSPQTVSYTPTATGKWNPAFYCLAGGIVYDWATAQGSTNSGSGSTATGSDCYNETSVAIVVAVCPPSPTGLSGCFASAGWSLTDPVSWVTGALHDGLCILEWAFVPSSSTLAGFTGLFSINSDDPSATSATAGQWLASLTAFASGWPTAAVGQIQSAEETGSCSAGPTVNLDGSSYTICSALSTASGATSFSVLDAIATAAFLVMIGLALFHMIRRVISGGGD